RVVRRARPVAGLVRDDAWIATDLLRARGRAQKVRIVALLPHEHEVRGSHELRDEHAARRGTRKRIRRDAVPARVALAVFAFPDLLVDLGRDVLDHARVTELEVLPFHGPNGSDTARFRRKRVCDRLPASWYRGPRAGGRGPRSVPPLPRWRAVTREPAPRGAGPSRAAQHRGERGCRPSFTCKLIVFAPR